MSRHVLIAVCVIAFACASVSTAPADTIRVPADQPTIQAGIDAAADGDVVLVADGVYTGPENKSLDFAGKAITVRGENGRDNCIIDCENDGRGFCFHSGESEQSVIEGLTIRNGRPFDEQGGGAVSCGVATGPTIVNCPWVRNLIGISDDGGEIACRQAAITLRSVTVTGNQSLGGGGAWGALYRASKPRAVMRATQGRSAPVGSPLH